MKCPLCQDEGEPQVDRQGYTFLRCEPCHHVYLDHRPTQHHVETVYDDSYFFGGGSCYDDYLANGEMLRERGRFYEEKLRALIPSGRVLDVGSSAGFIASAFKDAGWEAMGIEPNSHMAEHAEQAFGIPTVRNTMEQFSSDRRFDAITAIQVAAHFTDPCRAFTSCFDALRPGGLLLVETWDADSLTRRLLGSRWHEYSPPSVLNCFSKKSLRRLLDEVGFDQVACRTTLKTIPAAHATSLLRAKAGDSLTMRFAAGLAELLPDRLPLVYPADDLFWAVFRRPLDVALAS